jgi:hypothetical protein
MALYLNRASVREDLPAPVRPTMPTLCPPPMRRSRPRSTSSSPSRYLSKRENASCACANKCGSSPRSTNSSPSRYLSKGKMHRCACANKCGYSICSKSCNPSRYLSKEKKISCIKSITRMCKQMRVKSCSTSSSPSQYLSREKKISCVKKHYAHAQTNAGPVGVAPAPVHHSIWAERKRFHA